MSTANKLSYLNDTKSLLRTSLNKFGSSILSTDTFRSYDTKLNDIYDKLPKITQSGAGFTLENVQNGLLDDFKMIGVDLEQDTTTGKNLWGGFQNSFSKTNADIDFVTNKDGTITANGTANGTAYSMYGSEATNNGFLKTLSPGNYVISGATPEIAINVVKYDGTGISTTGSNLIATFTLSEETQLFVRLQIHNKTVNNVTIKPMLESGTTATNYEPYTGGIPSPNPDYPQEIKVVEGRQVITDKGKNLLDSSKIQTITQNGITCTYNSEKQEITFNGTCTSDNTLFYFNSTNIYAKKNITKFIAYYVSGTVENYVKLRFYDSNYMYGIIMDIINLNSSNDKITMYSDDRVNTSNYVNNSFRFNNGSVANNFKIKVMVTDDENTDYEPYYEPSSYNIDLQLENIYLAKMPNTDYKNRVYKNNGNWYYEKNIEKIILDGYVNSFSSKKGNPGNVYAINQISNLKSTSSNDEVVNAISNYFIADAYSNLGNLDNGIVEYHDSHEIRFKLGVNSSITTLNLANEWLQNNNVLLYYALATPVTTQITNATLINQLEAISVHTGTNIITISNSNNIIPEIEITRLKELEKLA